MAADGPDTTETTVQTAKDEAAGLAQSAASHGGDLMGTAKEQAADVAAEATAQARDVLGEARAGVAEQAAQQQQRAAENLRSLGDQLRQMADGADQGGLAPDLVRQAADRTGSVATWLEDREPGDVLHEVAEFARRKPGVFLGAAALAGLLVGRLTRGVKEVSSSDRSAPDGSGDEPQDKVRADTAPVPAVVPDASPDVAGADERPAHRAVDDDTPTVTLPAASPAGTAGQWPTGTGQPPAGAGGPPSGSVASEQSGSPGTAGQRPASDVPAGQPGVAHTPAGLPDADAPGTAGGDPLAGLRREDER